MILKQKKLHRITKCIKNDLSIFEIELKNAMSSDVKLINLIGKYILRHKGKFFRPILTLLSSRLCGTPSQNTYRAASMLELLHIATLAHDDVVDDAEKRRGFFSINRVWKNKIAILMGDFILSKTLINMVKLNDYEALQLIAETAEKLAAGEILQIEKSITRSMNEEIYYEMIYQKTASLISTCCELGALTTSANEKDRLSVRSYGKNLGMAFQIKDDLFDILGSQEETGKDMAADVKKNMITLPLIYAKQNLSEKKLKKLKNLLKIKNKSKTDIKLLKDLVKEVGGFAHAQKKIFYFSEKAKSSLKDFEPSEYKKSLIDLVDFNINRSG